MKIKLTLGLKDQPSSFFFEGELKTFKQEGEKDEPVLDYCSLLDLLRRNGYIVQDFELKEEKTKKNNKETKTTLNKQNLYNVLRNSKRFIKKNTVDLETLYATELTYLIGLVKQDIERNG